MAGALWAFLALALWSVWTIIMTRLRERLSGGSIARRSAGAAGTLFLWVGTMFFVLNPLSRASFDATKPAAWAAIGVMSLNSWFLAEVVGAVSHLLSGKPVLRPVLIFGIEGSRLQPGAKAVKPW